MGDGQAFQGLLPPLRWRERQEVKKVEQEEREEEVVPPIISLPNLEEVAMEGRREKKGSESMPWTWTAVGEVAWWVGATAAVPMNVGRTLSK